MPSGNKDSMNELDHIKDIQSDIFRRNSTVGVEKQNDQLSLDSLKKYKKKSS